MTPIHGWLIAYLSVISVLSIIACLYDKFAAKFIRGNRAREASLMLLSLLGGAPVMLLTMLIIRHKTNHAKFMVGIPLILLLQTIAVVCLHLSQH